jgi:AcrR family transcriptional regulator
LDFISEQSMKAETRERPQRSDARASRASLLAAAKELVAEDGLDALTVVGVARRAGLNRSTAYQHFRQREDLVDAVGAQFARELRALFSEPRELGEQIDFFAHHFRENPDIARIWMFHLLRDDDAVSKPGWDEYVSALERLSESPRSQDGIDAEMLCVIAMTSALVWSLMVRQRTSGEAQARAETDRFARELKRLFLHGALRPERWPELASELSEVGRDRAGASQRTGATRS